VGLVGWWWWWWWGGGGEVRVCAEDAGCCQGISATTRSRRLRLPVLQLCTHSLGPSSCSRPTGWGAGQELGYGGRVWMI
jgi:hypothetical protein